MFIEAFLSQTRGEWSEIPLDSKRASDYFPDTLSFLELD